MMKHRTLGKSGLEVSEIGFGCMSLPAADTDAVRILRRALDEGVTLFDTADLYDHGRNEAVVGRALKGRRAQVVLATKVGNRWRADGSGWDWVPSRSYILDAVHDSLRRLGTDYIDLYQLHGGTLEDPIDDIIDAFEQLQQQGVIRAYGISSIRPAVIREYVRKSGITSVMMQYSLLDRRPEEAALDLLHAHDIRVIARGPLARGWLSGRPAPDRTEGYLDHAVEQLLAVREGLSARSDDTRSAAHLALRYPLAHPAVAAVIPGASRLEQLLENTAAGTLPDLTPEELTGIQRLAPAHRYQAHR